MRRLILSAAISLIATQAFGYVSLSCYSKPEGVECFSGSGPLFTDAEMAAFNSCKARYSETLCQAPRVLSHDFQNLCGVVYSNSKGKLFLEMDLVAANAVAKSLAACINSENSGFSCKRVFNACDGAAIPVPFAQQKPQQESPSASASSTLEQPPSTRLSLQTLSAINLPGVAFGVSFGVGLIIVLLIFAARGPLLNFIIHGNLPKKLPVYGEDIQALFKLTQRVNWYGRVIFGIIINFSMTHQQFVDVRKYWLGRVVAFDSLRRQRQNQLARLHFEFAAQANSQAHDKKKFWSRRWANIRALFKMVFWIFIALFNLIAGLFFIRVTIAKLTRGTIVESKDLVLILQAKAAIEDSATYLKEYLTTANTFDERDEIYDPS